MKKPLILAGILFAALIVVGFTAMSSSSYMDVSKLQDINEEAKVVVKGQPLNLGMKKVSMMIGNSQFTVSFQGSYGVAEHTGGPVFGNEDSYAVFLLEGEDGYKVLALYGAKSFMRAYGGTAAVEGTVVVDGMYDPSIMATVYDPSTGASSQYGVVIVDKILEGCHSSYEKPAGSLG